MRFGLAWPVALLLILAALAGCTGGPGDSDDDQGSNGIPIDSDDENGDEEDQDDEIELLPWTWSYGGCEVLQGVFFPPRELFDWLPDGFSPVPGPDPAGQTVIILALAFDCANMTSPWAGEVKNVVEFHFYLAVDPPQEYQDSQMANYLFHMEGVIPNDDVRGLYEAAGVGLDDGGVTVSTQATPASRTGHVRVQTWSDFEFRTAAEGIGAEQGGFQVRTFGFTNNTVSHVIDFDVHPAMVSQGTGKLATTDLDDPEFIAMFAAVGTGTGFHFWDSSFSMTARPVETL